MKVDEIYGFVETYFGKTNTTETDEIKTTFHDIVNLVAMYHENIEFDLFAAGYKEKIKEITPFPTEERFAQIAFYIYKNRNK